MWDTLSNYLKQLSTVKSKRIRVLSVLLALSILVSANVFWMLRKPGMTMAGDAPPADWKNTSTARNVSSRC